VNGGGQTAAHTSQMNETGYAVSPAIVGAAELEEIAGRVYEEAMKVIPQSAAPAR